jgi:transmembrane sensor
MKSFLRWGIRENSAASWFSRVRSGRLDARVDKAWSEWMAEDVAHSKAYEDAELAWELSAELKRRPKIEALLREVDTQYPAGALRPAHRTRPAPTPLGLLGQRWRLAGFAAATMVCVGVLTYFVLNRTSVTDYTTAIGEQRTVTLPDDSQVTLNTATHLRVTYSRSVRRVDLLSGEALFHVQKDARRPFEVHALNGVTTAVGTEFDVQVNGASATVDVLKGAVKVEGSAGDPKGQAAQVTFGQGVDYTAAGAVSAIRTADTNRIRAWQAHRVVYTDIALDAALQDYNRYVPVPIVIGDPTLAARHINGVFRIGDQTAFLDAIEQGLHVKAVPMGSRIVLQRR